MKKTSLCILVAALIMVVVMPTVQAQNNTGAKKTDSNTTKSATKANKPTKLVVAGYNDDFTIPEFDGSGKDITIDVTTTASSYTVTQLPSWCSIGDKQSGEFTLHVNANGNSTPRRGAFFVNAGDKTIAVIISQKAATITSSTPSASSTLSTNPTSSSSANNITSSYANFKKLGGITLGVTSAETIIGMGFSRSAERTYVKFNHWGMDKLMVMVNEKNKASIFMLNTDDGTLRLPQEWVGTNYSGKMTYNSMKRFFADYGFVISVDNYDADLKKYVVLAENKDVGVSVMLNFKPNFNASIMGDQTGLFDCAWVVGGAK